MPTTVSADQRIDLVIARLGYTFVTDDTEVMNAVRNRFADAIAPSNQDHGFVSRVHRSEDPRLNEGPLAEIAIRNRRAVLTSATGLHAEVDFASGTARVLVGRDPLENSLENYLRMVNAVLVLERGGIHLHSAGVIRSGEGFVFFGPSDAGKTTTASFSGAYQVVSDDQNVLIPDGDTVILHGVPFKSVMCPVPTSPGRAPLVRLLRLTQAGYDGLERVPDGEAVAMLASQCPFVNFQPDLIDRLMHNCEQIVRRVPVERLHFTKGPDFWKIL